MSNLESVHQKIYNLATQKVARVVFCFFCKRTWKPGPVTEGNKARALTRRGLDETTRRLAHGQEGQSFEHGTPQRLGISVNGCFEQMILPSLKGETGGGGPAIPFI